MFMQFLIMYLLLASAPIGVLIGVYLLLRGLGFSFKPVWKR